MLGHSRFRSQAVVQGLRALLGIASACFLDTTARAEASVVNEALELRSGQSEPLLLKVRLRVAATSQNDGKSSPPPTSVLPLTTWKRDGEDWVSEPGSKIAGLQVKVRLRSQADGHSELFVETKATAPTWLRLLSLELESDSVGAEVGGRDLRPKKVTSRAALSGLDPKWVILRPDQKPWTILVDDDVDGVKVQVLPSQVLVQADLLSSESRPFVFFQQCTDHWRAPNRKASLETRLLQEGETLSTKIVAYAGGAMPLLKARYPEGRQAAFVITDHADQTTSGTLHALAGGTSLVSSPRFGKSGFLGKGLPMTKALWFRSGEPAPAASWAHPPHPVLSPFQKHMHSLVVYHSRYERPQVDPLGAGRPQLDDPALAELAVRLHRAGWEISPHSATPQPDDRDSTEEALRFFEQYEAKTWIDHQPYTNCEALTNRGFQGGNEGIADLLDRHKYRYAWSGIDVPASPSLNLLAPQRIDQYVPVVYPSGRLSTGAPSNLWLFSTMMTYIESSRFFALYKKKSLDQLEKERGLHIAHTYLEAFHPAGSKFAKRNLMQAGKVPGEIVPHPRLEQLLSQLQSRVAKGTLWVPTLQQLGDHLRAMGQVTVRLHSDGSATLHADTAVTAATFVVPRPGLSVLIDGQPLKTVRSGKTETMFYTDLAAGQTVKIELRDAKQRTVHLLKPVGAPTLIAKSNRVHDVVR
jgi:hypothetical protein